MRCKLRAPRAISRVGVIDVNVDHSINIGRVLQGGLFTSDFLIDAVQEMDEWQRWDEGAVLETEFQNIFNAFPIDQNPNESQTEDDLIWPILNQLGWKSHPTSLQQWLK